MCTLVSTISGMRCYRISGYTSTKCYHIRASDFHGLSRSSNKKKPRLEIVCRPCWDLFFARISAESPATDNESPSDLLLFRVTIKSCKLTYPVAAGPLRCSSRSYDVESQTTKTHSSQTTESSAQHKSGVESRNASVVQAYSKSESSPSSVSDQAR
jgi:hypothetical protein